MSRHLITGLSLTFLMLTAAARGQGLADGQRAFEDSKEYKETREVRRSLLKGETSGEVNNAAHQLALKIAAKELVYPVYWAADKSFTPNAVNKLVERYTDDLRRLSGDKVRERTAVTQQMLSLAVMELCKEVMPECKPMAAINVAMMLARIVERRTERGAIQSEKDWSDDVSPRLAGGNGDRLAAICLELFETERARDEKAKGTKATPGNDGVRYYLFRTLSATMGVPAKAPLLKPETEDKVMALALDHVTRKPKFPRTAAREELEGYKALRREALKVVATARTPVVGEKGQAALVLARYAAGDETITPAPRLDERMEAAIGLCRLIKDAAKSPAFHADYAVPCVVLAVRALGQQANPNIEKVGTERARAWKVDAARLGEAVDVMRGDGKNKYVSDAAKVCADVLTPLQNGTPATRVADMNEWLKTNQPTTKSIYQGVDDSTVKPAEEVEN